jgi:hypothetical protein
LDLLLGHRAQLVRKAGPRITPADVKEDRVRALVRLDFVDPAENFTPITHDTLGAAITRNVLHAAPERNLSQLLAAQARAYASLAPKFLADQRQLFELAWQD